MLKLFRKTADSLVIVSVILVVFTILTWIVPAGSFERQEVNGRTVVVPDTYTEAESNGQGLMDLLSAPFHGFESAADIIAFVLLVGGAFSMLTATGSIDAGLFRVLGMAKRRPGSKGLIIAILMTIFSLAGMSFGMSEETLVFVLITIPLARSMGYDAIVGVAIPFVGAGMGFAGAAFNPFTVAIAQGIAELTPFSGAGYRLVIWAVFTATAIVFVLRYCRLLEKGSIRPILGANDQENAEIEDIPFNTSRKLTLVLFVAALVMVMVGAMNWGWYIAEICALFIALGIAAVVVNRTPMEKVIKAFYDGAKMMLPAALIIALSKSILVVADNGNITDMMLNSLAGTVEGLPKAVSVQLMFLVQGAINFFI
ncbi:MAG: YfcC family protein, partial [Flavobacteriales bacterium]|nr:YfcC family protein [Flavobacteriales bacterium]